MALVARMRLKTYSDQKTTGPGRLNKEKLKKKLFFCKRLPVMQPVHCVRISAPVRDGLDVHVQDTVRIGEVLFVEVLDKPVLKRHFIPVVGKAKCLISGAEGRDI